VKSLGEIASLASGKTKPKDLSYLQSRTHAIPIYGGKGLLGFSSSFLRQGPTIILGRLGARCGAVHFVADERSWITDNALFVYESRPEVDLRFLYHSLCNLDLSSLRNMGRQPLISLATLYPVLLGVPPLAEQREICEVLASLETLITAQEKVLEQTRKVQSALPACVKAKLECHPF
jgi:type I restriction enzyme S subunit